MEILITHITKIEDIISSLEIILNYEYKCLLDINSDVKLLDTIVKKKIILFKNFSTLSQGRLSLEKKYNIFAPYKNHKKLKHHWHNIVSKCLLLKKVNLNNKILLNKRIYLNQNFLDLFVFDKKCVTYNINGDLNY